jgi:hypothetical protein
VRAESLLVAELYGPDAEAVNIFDLAKQSLAIR